MVDRLLKLDNIFLSLADPTRRDILRRISESELSVRDIARHYKLTYAAVSKHLKVLEKSTLVTKRRRGKEQLVSLSPQAFLDATEYLDWYKPFWTQKFDSLEAYLKERTP